ncbi:MAG: hypothetical protein MI975_04865 [Cytophagales bacterium]|nr:hypothetical protein [Cytophagales bacterium]
MMKAHKPGVKKLGSFIVELSDDPIKIVTSGAPVILKEKEYRKLLNDLKPDKVNLESLMNFLSINREVLAGMLGISETTAHRILREGRKLGKNELFRLQQLMEIILTGIDVFDYIIGDFVDWMHTKITEKENQTPIEIFINSAFGFSELKSILNRIDHTIYN